MAQAGLWDVDGQGLTKIDDPTLAGALMDKVNKFNVQLFIKATAMTAAFAILPKDLAVPITLCSAVCVALYYAEGKIPKSL